MLVRGKFLLILRWLVVLLVEKKGKSLNFTVPAVERKFIRFWNFTLNRRYQNVSPF